MATQKLRVAEHLRRRGLTFTEEWLEACIQWVKEENSSDEGVITDQFIQTEIYDQWIDTNLEDMESQCLPGNLSRERLKVLTGEFGLQINSLRDIGESAYSQYNKIKKLENENTSVAASDNTEFKFSWQPKARRCLYLTLTDGSQEVYGLETVQIPVLTLEVKPGAKVVISGPVDCRRGVLQLKPHHVKLLGGEVEALSSINSVENVLSRALHEPQPSPPEPAADSGISSRNGTAGTTGSTILRSLQNRTIPTQVVAVPAQPRTQSQVTQPVPARPPSPDAFDDDDFFMEIDEAALLGVAATGSNPATAPVPAVPPQFAPSASTSSKKPKISAVKPKKSEKKEKQKKISAYLKPVPRKIGPGGRLLSTSSTDEDIGVIDLEDDPGSDSAMSTTSTTRTNTSVKMDVSISEPVKKTNIRKAPFQYISQINGGLFKVGDVVQIRGIVATLTSNIAVDKATGEWMLSVNINDGSGYLVAKVSSQVLQQIIGFSPGQMKQMKGSKSQEGKQRVMQGMKNLTSSLVHFNGIMAVRITGEPEQVIVSITDICSEHVCALVNRTALHS